MEAHLCSSSKGGAKQCCFVLSRRGRKCGFHTIWSDHLYTEGRQSGVQPSCCQLALLAFKDSQWQQQYQQCHDQWEGQQECQYTQLYIMPNALMWALVLSASDIQRSIMRSRESQQNFVQIGTLSVKKILPEIPGLEESVDTLQRR